MCSPSSSRGPGPDGEDAAALRLLLGGVGQDDPARRRLLLLEDLDDQAVAQRLEIHALLPPVPRLRDTCWHSRCLSARHCNGSRHAPVKVPAASDSALLQSARAARVLCRRRRACAGCAGAGCSPRSGPAASRGVWALPKGLVDAGERPERHGRARGRGGDRRRGGSSASSATSATSTRARGADLQGRELLPGPLPRRPDRRPRRPHTATRSRRRAGFRSTRRLPARLRRRAGHGAWRSKLSAGSRPLCIAAWRCAGPWHAMYALNFYSPIVADQLRTRAQDRDHPARGQVREVQEGHGRPGPVRRPLQPAREVFDAVIDKVDVKRSASSRRARSSTTTRRSGAPRTWPTSWASSTTGPCPRRTRSR